VRRDTAVELLDRLHKAQNDFYSGQEGEDFSALLTPDVTWFIPGRNSIAGAYRGIENVLGYFRRRRQLAAYTFKLIRRDVLVGEGDRVAALTDGRALINGIERQWSTVGLYAFCGPKVKTCWLLPLDFDAFDEIWGRPE
jgi:uncharacterized protein